MHNFIVYAVTALVPLLTGFIWYNPKVFGKAWMASTGLTQESAQKGFNMPLVFGITYLMGFFLSFILGTNSIHQNHLFLMTMPEPGDAPNPAVTQWVHDGWSMIGHSYRRYRHGALEGVVFGILAVLPIVTVNALFERRGLKYIAVTVGFWTLNATIMGAILCHWLLVELPK